MKDIYELKYKDALKSDQIGTYASKLLQIDKLDVSLPQGFIISSKVFDDYVQYNNLINPILDLLSDLDSGKSGADKVAKEIQGLILDGKFSDNIIRELEIFYKKFSAFSKAPTQIIASFVNESLDKSVLDKQKQIKQISNLDDLFLALKAIWAHLFSKEAIEYRESINYEGPLSLAVVVIKEPIAEVSAVVRKVKDLQNGYNLEIRAILGKIDPLLEEKLLGDLYIFDIQNKRIIEKNIQEQKWMIVSHLHKNRFEDRKIDISKVWRNKQKLSDFQIQQLSDMSIKILSDLNNPLILRVCLELGSFVLLDYEELVDYNIAFVSEFRDKVSIKDKLEIMSSVDLIKEDATEDTNDTKKDVISSPAEKTKYHRKKKPITDYVKEVEREIEKLNGLEETSKPEQKSDLIDKHEAVLNQDEDEKEVIPLERVETAISVWCNTFNKIGYKKYEKNIEGFVNLSGDQFIIESKLDFKELLNDDERITKLLINYLLSYLDDIDVEFIYTFSSNVYREDLNSVFGAERLLGGNSILEQELEAVRYVRNTLGKKNLSVAIPFLRSEEEFMDIKKAISLSKLRRSSTFKIYARVDNLATTSFAKDLLEDGADGIIYDFDNIVKNEFGIYIIKETPIKAIKDIVINSIKQLSGNSTDIMFKANGMNDDIQLKEIYEAGITDIIVNIEQVEDIKKSLRKIERKKLR